VIDLIDDAVEPHTKQVQTIIELLITLTHARSLRDVNVLEKWMVGHWHFHMPSVVHPHNRFSETKINGVVHLIEVAHTYLQKYGNTAPSAAPMIHPQTTSEKKCLPSTIRPIPARNAFAMKMSNE